MSVTSPTRIGSPVAGRRRPRPGGRRPALVVVVEPPHAASASAEREREQLPEDPCPRIASVSRFSTDSLKLVAESTTAPRSREAAARAPAHVTLAVVLQVRDGALQVLLWQRAHEPFAGAWALPGGYLEPGETLEESIRRHLAVKVDVRELSHLEQLETRSDPEPTPTSGSSRPRYLGLVPDLDPALPGDTAWHPVDACRRSRSTTHEIALAGRERLRAKLSYTNAGFALAPETFTISELRDLYAAALGHAVSTTNLQRVLLRRGLLVATGERREPGRSGGRPAALYRFRARRLEITDQFAVLRPPAA